MEISTKYNPKELEKKWYDYWEKNKFFHAKVNEDKKPFTIVIPPPNVTGALHLGHALNNTLQDVLIRFKRMQGFEALWMPGTDHAGIATQIKVEEMLKKEEGLTRYDLGRKTFIEKVWDWKKKYGNKIIEQLKGLGCSCDWDRERFTMDQGCSLAVREVFVSLYEKDLIYQGRRIINWCIRCHTALSDIEVEYKDLPGKLYYVKYKLADANDCYIEIATTRPETILGDTALAVNPNDKRYKNFIGKHVILPSLNKIIPIISDDYVDESFGTGVVKITPAHDPNDFEVGLRHNLEQVVVIGLDGKMTKEAGKYQGLDRYECRLALLQELQELNLLSRIEEHEHAVGHCERCETVIEPLMSKQWFVKMQPLAKPAIEVVEQEKVNFIPTRFTKTYANWMNNIRDWCISRQIWWGHQIPAWYCQECNETIVSRVDVEKCTKCNSTNLKREEDVLDTWFSSALWPFSTLGWPEKTPELSYFYPTNVLVTGYDIIFFWVARMIFSGLEFMKEKPFDKVFLTGLVRDAEGRKMSKSLGNGIDPMDIIENYGADTLRFALALGNTPGNDMRFHTERVESSRNFTNKIWNASRFVLMNLKDYLNGNEDAFKISSKDKWTLAEHWIISRYQKTVTAVTEKNENFEPGEAAQIIYDFIWDEFCDWYIELSKIHLYQKEESIEKDNTKKILLFILANSMKLLHPFMPFISEEIWQNLQTGNIKNKKNSIMIAKWPVADVSLYNEEAEQKMAALMEVIKSIRNMRAELNVPLGKKCEIVFLPINQENAILLKDNINYIKSLANVIDIEIRKSDNRPENASVAVCVAGEVFLLLQGLIDVEKETAKLNKEILNIQKEIERLENKLQNKGFVNKAPLEVVEKERAKLLDYSEKQKVLQLRITELNKQ